MNIHTRQIDPIKQITDRWEATAGLPGDAAAREKDEQWSAKMEYAPPHPVDLDDYQSIVRPVAQTYRGHLRLKGHARPLAIEDEATNPLSELAILLAALTYGEMTELAAALWRVKPAEGELNKETLPETLHRWSTSNG